MIPPGVGHGGSTGPNAALGGIGPENVSTNQVLIIATLVTTGRLQKRTNASQLLPRGNVLLKRCF